MNRLRRQRGDLSDSTHACLHQRPNQWLGLVIGILALHTPDVATYGKNLLVAGVQILGTDTCPMSIMTISWRSGVRQRYPSMRCRGVEQAVVL